MMNYDEMEFFPEDLVVNANCDVVCKIVKQALEKDPIPEIYY
jgi:hypothetical protein